jgi:membrane protein DedA with SNARE-associated domain
MGGMEAQVALWIGAFSYPAVFLLLVLCGLGAPLSEELIILTGGLVVVQSGAHLQGMMLTAYLGVLAGDSALYFVGRSLGQRVFTHPRLARMLTPSRLAFLRQLFDRRGSQAVFLARFLPGVRAPAFLLAGASGLPYRRFLLADGAAAWVGALGLTWLGYRYGPGILSRVQGGLRWLLLAVGVVGAGVLLRRWLRRRPVRALPRRAES